MIKIGMVSYNKSSQTFFHVHNLMQERGNFQQETRNIELNTSDSFFVT